MPPDEPLTSNDPVPAKYMARFVGPMYIPAAYNAALLGLTEITKAGFPPGFEDSPFPSTIYERTNCSEGVRFANLMQDMFLNIPPQLLESLVLGGTLGALGGALMGGVYGIKNSKTRGGKIKSTLSGALAGGAFGSMMGSSTANIALFNSAVEYFGEWTGQGGLDIFNKSAGYGIDIVAAMALLYPIMLGLTFLPLIYTAYKIRKPLIEQAENLTDILHENGVV